MSSKAGIKVSVIITARNYGQYLSQCIDSVLSQKYTFYEIIAVNDGSTDNTAEILEGYRAKHPDRIKVITLAGAGLAKACNAGIRNSSGEYIIRLDADDYFDENILLVEANILDNNPDVHLVYTDYYRIDKHGGIIDSYRLPKVNDEVELLDRSPLAGGAMFRRECYEAIGGYSEELRYQEDYDFWIRFIDRFKVYNVNLPLMYYRRHSASMSNNFDERMKARQYVKKKFVDEKGYRKNKKIFAVIPAMGHFRGHEKLALRKLNGRPLIAYTIEQALKTKLIARVIVSTEDEEVANTATELGADVPFLRPQELARTSVGVDEVLRHMVGVWRESGEAVPDLIVVLPYIAVFQKERHITEAIDTVLLHDTDSVIGVTTDLTFHWKPGKYGLEPVGYHKRLLREDRETVYKETASIYVLKTAIVEAGGYLGEQIGHIEMSLRDAWRIQSDFDFLVAEKILEEAVYKE
ncbi:MAG: glycosyltransferase [Candidatus Omnitrophica bacterium]|nr:glycosyltransferase [Candidatus Omnitrophota bacterium]